MTNYEYFERGNSTPVPCGHEAPPITSNVSRIHLPSPTNVKWRSFEISESFRQILSALSNHNCVELSDLLYCFGDFTTELDQPNSIRIAELGIKKYDDYDAYFEVSRGPGLASEQIVRAFLLSTFDLASDAQIAPTLSPLTIRVILHSIRTQALLYLQGGSDG